MDVLGQPRRPKSEKPAAMGSHKQDRKKKANMSSSELKKQRKAVKAKMQGKLQHKRQGLSINPAVTAVPKGSPGTVSSKYILQLHFRAKKFQLYIFKILIATFRFAKLKRPPKHERERIASLSDQGLLAHRKKLERIERGPDEKITSIPYRDDEWILVVGDGDFSFSAGLGRRVGWMRIVATGYDSEEVVRQKYKGTRQFQAEITGGGGHVLFGVDATRLLSGPKLARAVISERKWDKVVFNFPHTGSGMKDADRNVAEQQALLRGFFESVKEVITPDAEVHVTVKDGPRYALWDTVGIAKHSGFVVKASCRFLACNFAPYRHRRTSGYHRTKVAKKKTGSEDESGSGSGSEDEEEVEEVEEVEEDGGEDAADDFILGAKTYQFVLRKDKLSLSKKMKIERAKKRDVEIEEEDMAINKIMLEHGLGKMIK
jgi:25S rRNA (uracil2634-N3)-methyltransferase